MHFITPLLPFAAGWSLLFFTADLAQLGWVNGLAQLVLFALVVCIPAWKTGRLSYVDIGWPLGLALIGVVTLALADGQPIRKLVISLVYLFIGLRMGLGAIKMWRNGFFQTEFPRYQYQRLRWERKGIKNIPLMIGACSHPFHTPRCPQAGMSARHPAAAKGHPLARWVTPRSPGLRTTLRAGVWRARCGVGRPLLGNGPAAGRPPCIASRHTPARGMKWVRTGPYRGTGAGLGERVLPCAPGLHHRKQPQRIAARARSHWPPDMDRRIRDGERG